LERDVVESRKALMDMTSDKKKEKTTTYIGSHTSTYIGCDLSLS
jgi:hypothetical protein